MIVRKNLALILLIVISAFALLYAPIRGAITNTLYLVVPRIWGIGDTTQFAWNSFVTNFNEKNNLALENDRLKEEILHMQAQVLDRNLLAEKVDKLEEAFGRIQSDNRVVANVIAGPGLSPYDTLVVDAGVDSGVAIGNKVVYAGSGTIGEIIEASTESSKVKIYSSPGNEILVRIGTKGITAKAVGRGMGTFLAKIPQDSVVVAGDNVLLLKDGLLLGVVMLVENEPALPFMNVLFRVPFNITEIKSVEIIIDKRS